MELGERIRQARQELGLSQRQLCGETITRNMLSQIENGAARPSMDTLRTLSARLGKPVSFFLEEVSASPNQESMAHARAAFAAGSWESLLEILQTMALPDPVFEDERGLLLHSALLALAERAAAEGQKPYALRLLDRAEEIQSVYLGAEQCDRRMCLLGQLAPERITRLPQCDAVLLLRASEFLRRQEPGRAKLALLALDRQTPESEILLGRACLALSEYEAAAAYLCGHEDEDAVLPLLEQAYAAMGDYQRAYEYAKRQRR